MLLLLRNKKEKENRKHKYLFKSSLYYNNIVILFSIVFVRSKRDDWIFHTNCVYTFVECLYAIITQYSA